MPPSLLKFLDIARLLGAGIKCPACKGSGNETCASRGCKEDAVGFNEDGEALCDICLTEWIEDTYGRDEQ